MVPELPIASSGAPGMRRGSVSATVSAAYWRIMRRCLGLTEPLASKISDRRTAPSDKLHSATGRSPRALAISVEPPPMSMTSDEVRSGLPRSTPRQVRRASSRPETTSSSSPASRRTRARISSLLCASRTALVATARTRAR